MVTVTEEVGSCSGSQVQVAGTIVTISVTVQVGAGVSVQPQWSAETVVVCVAQPVAQGSDQVVVR